MSRRTSLFGASLASPPPGVAVQITGTSVIAVALAAHGGKVVVSGHTIEPLPPGVATPTLNGPNIHDERALSGAIRAALHNVAHRGRRIALVLPDSVAKVSLVRFEKVPAKVQDLDELIRWQMRKAAPFRIDDAQVSWQAGLPTGGGGREYLVTVARRDIVKAYERAAESAGAHAGLVDIVSFNQINAVLATGAVAGDWLLVNVASDYATLAVVRDDGVVFFRNRAAGTEGDLADLVHQTAMYHEDRLGGGGFARVVLAGASVIGVEDFHRLQHALEARIGSRVEPIDFRPAAELRDRIAASPELLDLLAAPVGVVLRERRASARTARPERAA